MTGLPADDALFRHFGELLELEEAARQRRLEELAQQEPVLAHALRELLVADAGTGPVPTRPGTPLGHPHASPGAGIGASVDAEAVRADLAEVAATSGGRRYELGPELGHGAMGRVRRVVDRALRRELAMKTLRDDRLGGPDPVRLARFLNEARILGQLDHPGIVSVHELGVDAEEQPYFTMPVVSGGDLRAAFEKVRAGEDGWSLPRAVGVLQRVCEAMAYAHGMEVVHRDLKPTNVMVGSFGEVLVMDWGIARRLGEPDPRDLRPRESGAGGSGGDRSPVRTMDGAVIGTPYFMSPEQARGETQQVDQRSDVYAVGAMLYELLAGHPPYAEPERNSAPYVVLLRVQQGEVPTLPQDAPPELAAICERAMARDPRERYATMEALTEDLRAFLEGRVVAAYETGAWAEARKWVRRNKALAVALAAVLVVTVGGLGGVGFVQAKGRAAEQEQRRRADLKAVEAQENEHRAHDAEREARAEAERASLAEAQALARAEELELVAEFQAEQLRELDVPLMGVRLRRGLIEAAPEERRDQLSNGLAGLNFTNLALDTLRVNLFDRTVETIDAQFAEQPLVRAKLLQTMADTLRGLGLLEMASGPQERALAIRRRALGDEHPDTLTSICSLGFQLRAQGELSNAELSYREALEASRRVLGDQHPSTLIVLNHTASLLVEAGKLTEAASLCREALETSRRVLGDEHLDTLVAINNMGFLLNAQGKPSEAEPYYREALDVRRRVLGEEHPSTLISMNQMGFLLNAQGKPSEAEPYYREALDTSRRVLGDEHPRTLSAVNNMASVLDAQGMPSEAEPYYREALEVRRRVLGDDHPSTLTSIHNMAFVLQKRGKLNEAESYGLEAIERKRRVLGDDHPKTLTSIHNMGSLLRAQGRLDEAEPFCREALETSRRVLGDEHPTTLSAINNMATLLQDQGKLEEAGRFLREALETRRRVLGAEHPDTLTSINNFASLLYARGKLDEAEPFCREALEALRRVLGSEHPDTLGSMKNLGSLLRAQGKHEEAERYLREALEVRRRVLGAEHPDTRESITSLELLLSERVGAARRAGDYFELGKALFSLGNHLVKSAKYAEAETALLEALDLLDGDPYLDPRIQRATSDLGAAIAGQGRLEEAEPLLVESATWVLATPRSETGEIESAREILQRVMDLYDRAHPKDPGQGAAAEQWQARVTAWSE